MANRLRGVIRFWLPVALWLGWMFFASTDVMSSEHTSRFIGPILRWWKPDITQSAIESIQLIIRKIAHAADYAILAGLLWRAIRHQAPMTAMPAGGQQGRSSAFVATLTFASAIVLAVLDEFHQSFVPSRTSSARDVMID